MHLKKLSSCLYFLDKVAKAASQNHVIRTITKYVKIRLMIWSDQATRDPRDPGQGRSELRFPGKKDKNQLFQGFECYQTFTSTGHCISAKTTVYTFKIKGCGELIMCLELISDCGHVPVGYEVQFKKTDDMIAVEY